MFLPKVIVNVIQTMSSSVFPNPRCTQPEPPVSLSADEAEIEEGTVELLRVAYDKIKKLEEKAKYLQNYSSQLRYDLEESRCRNTEPLSGESLQKIIMEENKIQTENLRALLNLKVFGRISAIMAQIQKLNSSLSQNNNLLLQLQGMQQENVADNNNFKESIKNIVNILDTMGKDQIELKDYVKRFAGEVKESSISIAAVDEIKKNIRIFLQVMEPLMTGANNGGQTLQGFVAQLGSTALNMEELKKTVIECGAKLAGQVGNSIAQNERVAKGIAKHVIEQNNQTNKILTEVVSLKEITEEGIEKLMQTFNNHNTGTPTDKEEEVDVERCDNGETPSTVILERSQEKEGKGPIFHDSPNQNKRSCEERHGDAHSSNTSTIKRRKESNSTTLHIPSSEIPISSMSSQESLNTNAPQVNHLEINKDTSTRSNDSSSSKNSSSSSKTSSPPKNNLKRRNPWRSTRKKINYSE